MKREVSLLQDQACMRLSSSLQDKRNLFWEDQSFQKKIKETEFLGLRLTLLEKIMTKRGLNMFPDTKL